MNAELREAGRHIHVCIEMLQDDQVQISDDEWEPAGTQSWRLTADWGSDEAGAIERAQLVGRGKCRVVRVTTTREILWENSDEC